MKKLLLIEDSKLFAKAVSRTLSQNNFFEVHHAASLAEMQELLDQHDYFAAIADLVLPDASNGEAVQQLTADGIPVVAMTGSVACELQETITRLPILDYVGKEGAGDIAYAVRLVELLLSTHQMKVLVVNGDTQQLAKTVRYIEPFKFNILCSSRLSEAQKLIQSHPDIALIICDDTLADETPGLNLVRHVRRETDALSIPILYCTEDKGPGFDARLLKSGVNDFVIKPYCREELISRLITQLNSRIRYKQVQDFNRTLDRYIISSSTDEYGLIRKVSQAFCDISGYTREELIGRSHNIVRHPDMKNSIYRELWQTIRSGKSWQGELKNRKKDGSHYWVNINIDPQFDASGTIIGYTAIRQDITDKKHVETLSVTDPMTSLYNRRHFNNAFSQVSEEIAAKGRVLAFLIFDVDHFKAYNDNYGHQAGDEVLIAIGQCVQDNARAVAGFGYRLGGEEFALLYQAKDEQDAVKKAEQLRAAIENLHIRHEYNSASDYVTASFGLYLQRGCADVTETYKEGDRVLYQAKESGRNRVCYAQRTMPADGQPVSQPETTE